jgi:hypothetical protein
MKPLRCKIKGHSLSPVSTQPFQIKEFECTRCNQKFTTDGYGRLVKFTRYWKENHDFFNNHFKKRIIS